MRSTAIVLLAVLSLPVLQGGIGLGPQAPSDRPPIFRVDAPYVKVPVTVLDPEGRSILGLRAGDFSLFIDGQPRPIANFVLDTAPIHVAFLLDTSGSLRDELDQIRFATLRFAQHFGKEDRLCVVAFSDEFKVLQSWTNDYGELRKSTRKLARGYRTALYDSLFQSVRLFDPGVQGKRVVILLTDGLDNQSTRSYDSTLDELTANDIVLYIVSRTRMIQSKVERTARIEFLTRVMKNVLDDDQSFVGAYFREKEIAMNRLAEVNAGRVFYPTLLQALGNTYVQIAEELKTQYVLTFLDEAPSGPGFREIKVTCNREAVQVFHRRLYLPKPHPTTR